MWLFLFKEFEELINGVRFQLMNYPIPSLTIKGEGKFFDFVFSLKHRNLNIGMFLLINTARVPPLLGEARRGCMKLKFPIILSREARWGCLKLKPCQYTFQFLLSLWLYLSLLHYLKNGLRLNPLPVIRKFCFHPFLVEFPFDEYFHLFQ